jgi:hypothetical protein
MENLYPAISIKEIDDGLAENNMAIEDVGGDYGAVQDFIKQQSQFQAIADAGGVANMASGGMARASFAGGLLARLGKFTKAEFIIQRMKNSLKQAFGKTDPDSKYVNETFPNMIKELEVKPELGNNPNVWKMFSEDLPKNQRVVVHSDDSVSFFRQSNFGPQNIKTTMKFAEENNISVKEASRILKMEPEDRILEITRLKAIRQMKKGGLARILEM